MNDPLVDLVHDLWWTTRPEADLLFRDLDPFVWEEVGHNPKALLHKVDTKRAPGAWQRRAEKLLARWYEARAARPDPVAPKVAYFCMEFGLHEALPIYAGGLGILAGDHLRSACDLGLDLRAVGLFYHQGFFHQQVTDGHQVARYHTHAPTDLPIRPVAQADGTPLKISVPYRHGQITARVWRVEVGSVSLYLLDTHVEGNTEPGREATLRLYGGDHQNRIAQEILLGIGGVRLLRALGESPSVFHMNEGHSSFLLLELWAEGIRAGLGRDEAWEKAKAQCVFTTHTPVPAGHDRFAPELIADALGPYEATLGLEPGAFVAKGRFETEHGPRLCMTTLALRGSRAQNGVSALHGKVSTEMWSSHGFPIDHVTNGVHPTSWLAPELIDLFDAHVPGWDRAFLDGEFWARLEAIPPSALRDAKSGMRRRLLGDLRRRLGVHVLDEAALTLGFARRFATYKRATLLFKQPDRLARILDQGVQLVFSGKAHPQDNEGQAVLAELLRHARDPRFSSRVLFVPHYDIALGRLLTQGADVWVNTPRRPREASGTSGQKAAINGTLNCSILDGWWPEAFDGTNGWAIGGEGVPSDVGEQDRVDGESLYQVLEEGVVPAWNDPTGWARRMVRSMRTCIPVFNTHRMVSEYRERFYESR